MNRRDFTLISASLATAFLFPSLHCTAPLPQPDQGSVLPAELSVVLDRNEINQIGEKYRTINTKADDIKGITKLLFTNDKNQRYDGPDDENSLKQYLSMKIMNDFATDKTIEIDGWVLSHTEAQQCAWLSLNP